MIMLANQVNILHYIHRSKVAYQGRGHVVGGGGGGERVKARPRAQTRKTEEAVDRHQNNGSVKAVSPRGCVATSVLRNCCFNCCAGQSQGRCP